jgi:hypothetical protein
MEPDATVAACKGPGRLISPRNAALPLAPARPAQRQTAGRCAWCARPTCDAAHSHTRHTKPAAAHARSRALSSQLGGCPVQRISRAWHFRVHFQVHYRVHFRVHFLLQPRYRPSRIAIQVRTYSTVVRAGRHCTDNESDGLGRRVSLQQKRFCDHRAKAPCVDALQAEEALRLGVVTGARGGSSDSDGSRLVPSDVGTSRGLGRSGRSGLDWVGPGRTVVARRAIWRLQSSWRHPVRGCDSVR